MELGLTTPVSKLHLNIHIGGSDVTVICGHIMISMFVRQHGVLCEVKWWRSIAVIE